MFIKGIEFCLWLKNIDKNIDKIISKSLSGEYSQNILGHTRQAPKDALKTVSKTGIRNSKSNW